MQSQQDYHRELADSLMKSIGYEDAIEWALGNQWEGVLEQLLRKPLTVQTGEDEAS
ncbi:MAG: hypothetical protein H8E39_10265 [Alphaproteobacteria bacterium]|nr:hypothetical protein [Alphaproteobacteria bacterium]